MKTFFDNTATSQKGRGSKAHSYTFYLDKIKELDIQRECKLIEVVCTDGDLRPPYPYQWRAISTTIPGDDDPFEGLGESPLEALKNLYEGMKDFVENPPEDEEEIKL